MCSILTVIRNVRNICAHHGRLWNKQLFFAMKFPKHPKILAASLVAGEKSIYNVITILIFFIASYCAPIELGANGEAICFTVTSVYS